MLLSLDFEESIAVLKNTVFNTLKTFELFSAADLLAGKFIEQIGCFSWAQATDELNYF